MSAMDIEKATETGGVMARNLELSQAGITHCYTYFSTPLTYKLLILLFLHISVRNDVLNRFNYLSYAGSRYLSDNNYL